MGPMWNGARWWSFDFHAHTPASEHYGKGPEQEVLKNKTPKEWLLNYMQAGIDCVAVTDNNTGAWVDALKDALQELREENRGGFRELVLFPGVEISVHAGIHVLAIFGTEKTTSDIDTLLGAVKFRGEKGRSDTCTELSFIEVVSEVIKAGGLVIPAHVDGPSGLLKEWSGETLRQALKCSDVIAMELCNPSFTKPASYYEVNPRWTEVLGSDAHHFSGNDEQKYPGSHFTWVKMGEPNLEGLRLALLDGLLSVRRSDQERVDPNRHAPLIVEAVEVRQSRYMGRSRSFRLKMNPWLNAIIGGRGTGKSTLVEFLRLALHRVTELPDSLAGDFAKYRKVYRSRDDDGLLTEDSHFIVTYRKDRTRFRVQWNQRDDAEQIKVQDENGEWKNEQGDVAQRFPVRIYSQKQIFELAKDPLALLRIVDDALEVDRRSWENRWKEEETRFLSLRAKAREIETGLTDEARLRGELEDVKRRIAVFEEAGYADVLKEYQRRLHQQREAERWEQSWAGAGDHLRELAANLMPEPLDDSIFDRASDEDRDFLEKVANLLKLLEVKHTKLEELARELDEAWEQWVKNRDDSAWKQAVKRAIDEYGTLCERLKTTEEVDDPSAYGELVERRQMLTDRLKELESRRQQLKSVRRDANESLEQLKRLRRELTQRRASFLNTVLADNPYVRIEVIPYGARQTVELDFRRLIQREEGGFERDIGTVQEGGMLGSLYETGADPIVIEQRLAEIKEIVQIAAAGRDQDGLRDRRFAAYLAKLPPEAFDRLNMWFPEDSLQVQYSTTGNGSGFRSIHEGSPGQKTAAFLAFIFSYGEEPVILDQPEDDLDNYLIYDLIVTQLRRIKTKRQVIVVTHNANIVVNGDAELVVALTARGGETHQECAGCLQERKVRDTICAVMEGGREAFEQRYRRIALEVQA